MPDSEKPVLPEFFRTLKPSVHIPYLHHYSLFLDNNHKPIRRKPNQDLYAPIDIASFFGKNGPLEIEIGCGKGGFMLEYCKSHPKQPFLAVEKEYEYASIAAKRIAKRRELQHIRTVAGDAFFLLRDCLPSQSIKAFHIYFPDPWPKKRHQKRRLITRQFMDQVARTATSNASLFWGTDHEVYHEEAISIFQSIPWLKMADSNAAPTEGIMTNFEKKYRKEGRTIFRHHYLIQYHKT